MQEKQQQQQGKSLEHTFMSSQGESNVPQHSFVYIKSIQDEQQQEEERQKLDVTSMNIHNSNTSHEQSFCFKFMHDTQLQQGKEHDVTLVTTHNSNNMSHEQENPHLSKQLPKKSLNLDNDKIESQRARSGNSSNEKHESRSNSDAATSDKSVEDNGRERLKRHRVEVAGHVWIPDIWGQEELLKDWIDCSAFDASLMNSNIVSARASLVEASTRASSTCRLRIENSC